MAETAKGNGELKVNGLGLPANPSVLNTEGLRNLDALVSRMQLAARAGIQFDGARDLYTVFGYKKVLSPNDFMAKYIRQDITSRIVDAPPGATWSNPPTIKGNDTLNEEWQTLVKKTKLLGALHRADRLARLNPFSIVLFGFSGGGSLKKPITRAKELLYVRAFGTRQIEEIAYNTDPKNPRFGLPETYRIKFDDPATKSMSGSKLTTTKIKDLVVHHSRVVHVVENPLEDTTSGTPIVEKCYNLLDDLLKVCGGTAEMFWLTGNAGLHADIDSEMEIDPADAAALSDEITEYQHQLRRVIRTRGVKLNTLQSTVPDPKANFEVIMSLLSGTTGIPRRILLGSEAGQLASEQDRANWAERIEERRVLSTNPGILDPTLELLQRVGLLPAGDAEWKWPSAFIQNPLEIGQTQAQIARSVGNLSRQTGASTPMQLLKRIEMRELLGYEGDLEESDIHVPPDWQNPAKKDAGGGGKESDADKAARAEKKDDQTRAD